jgi:hypothetical protein
MSEFVVGKYKIDPVLFQKGFAKGCGPFQCETTCCASGVYLDPHERDIVVEHKEEIKPYMDETQSTDDSKWFDNVYETDLDFPSGTCVGTEVINDKCAFLRNDGRCSIQLLSAEKYSDPWKIKPFYCIAFPIAVVDGELTYDDYQDGKTECCSITTEKEVSLVVSCKAELEFVLGVDGYKELVELQNSYLK